MYTGNLHVYLRFYMLLTSTYVEINYYNDYGTKSEIDSSNPIAHFCRQNFVFEDQSQCG